MKGLHTILETLSAADCRVYFRADDAGVPGQNWDRLVRLFLVRKTPLNIALVPAWLSPDRWQAMAPVAGRAGSLFCWHQHGWRHVNHEPQGKKQEFGPARPASVVRAELEQGAQKMEALLGNHFYPAFTPPWNRCAKPALDQVRALGYKALSRDAKASPRADLPEFPVHVDLHTRKNRETRQQDPGLLQELASALESGLCGIMIHHMRMGPADFEWLDQLLVQLRQARHIIPLTFRDLVTHGG